MLSSEPRSAQRMSSIASTVFGDSLERASVMVRLTAEVSLVVIVVATNNYQCCLATNHISLNSSQPNPTQPMGQLNPRPCLVQSVRGTVGSGVKVGFFFAPSSWNRTYIVALQYEMKNTPIAVCLLSLSDITLVLDLKYFECYCWELLPVILFLPVSLFFGFSFIIIDV